MLSLSRITEEEESELIKKKKEDQPSVIKLSVDYRQQQYNPPTLQYIFSGKNKEERKENMKNVFRILLPLPVVAVRIVRPPVESKQPICTTNFLICVLLMYKFITINLICNPPNYQLDYI